MDDKEFNYTYSAPTEEERKEIQNIQRQYMPKDAETKDEKMAKLRKLDVIVKTPAKAISSIIGVIGFLCFGLGMSMALEWQMILWGAIVGIVGLVLMAFAYPIFNKIFSKRKEKYAEQILALSKNLLNANKEDNVSFDIK